MVIYTVTVYLYVWGVAVEEGDWAVQTSMILWQNSSHCTEKHMVKNGSEIRGHNFGKMVPSFTGTMRQNTHYFLWSSF